MTLNSLQIVVILFINDLNIAGSQFYGIYTFTGKIILDIKEESLSLHCRIE